MLAHARFANAGRSYRFPEYIFKIIWVKKIKLDLLISWNMVRKCLLPIMKRFLFQKIWHLKGLSLWIGGSDLSSDIFSKKQIVSLAYISSFPIKCLFSFLTLWYYLSINMKRCLLPEISSLVETIIYCWLATEIYTEKMFVFLDYFHFLSGKCSFFFTNISEHSRRFPITKFGKILISTNTIFQGKTYFWCILSAFMMFFSFSDKIYGM